MPSKTFCHGQRSQYMANKRKQQKNAKFNWEKNTYPFAKWLGKFVEH